jgi:hypothetical protein
VNDTRMVADDDAVLLALEASAYAAAAAHLRGSFRDTALVLHDSFDDAGGEAAVWAILEVCRGELSKVAADSDCEPSVLMAMLLSASRSLPAGVSGDSEVVRTLSVLSSELAGDQSGRTHLVAEVVNSGEPGPFIASGIATLANVLALRAELEGVNAAELAISECLARTIPQGTT